MHRLSLAIFLVSATAHAEPDEFMPHVGAELRDHGGVHLVRVEGGVRYDHLQLDVVLDPLFWLDDTYTNDATLGFRFDSGFALHAGWRDTAIGTMSGARFYESVVIGASTPLVGRASSFELRAGVELATLVLAHGADAPSQWISFDSGRRFIDSYGIDLFLEVRYGH